MKHFCMKDKMGTVALVCAAPLASLALTTATIDWTTYKATPEPSSVMLTFATDARSRGFAWQTDATVSESKVWILEGRYGAADAAEFETNGRLFEGTSSNVVTTISGTANSKVMRHKVLATGLRHATTYSYRLGGGGTYVYGTFALNDVQDEVTILNLTDAQTKDMTKLFMWENTVSNAVATAGQPDMVLYGGDLYDENSTQLKPSTIYLARTNPAKYRQWGISCDTATPYLPGIPWAFSQGNHDFTVYSETTAISYGKTISVGSYTVGCQSFDYGRVHIATLPYMDGWSESTYGAVADWLDADLKAARASGKTDWLIVAMHWGVYVTGDHFVDVSGSKNLLLRFAPIMSANHVDLVVQGHDHVFTKTLPYRWDAAGYTTTFKNDAVVNLAPATQTIGGETFDVDPNGTYYICCGCAGHRCGDGNEAYANAELKHSKCYSNCTYKIETDTIDVDTSAHRPAGVTKYGVGDNYRQKGDNASADLSADMFGVLKVKGDTLSYDFYVVETNGTKEAVLFDTLRVKKTLTRASRFSITPYLQHPAQDAMSLVWFTREAGAAKISWKEEGASDWQGEALTSGVWAEALTNNTTTSDSMAWGKQYRHRHRITGLAAGTRYAYKVELANGVSYANTFKTAPAQNAGIRFIYYNDSETAPSGTTSDWTDPATGNNRTYYVSKNVGYASNIVHMVKRQPDLFIVAGDLASHGGLQSNWDTFWKHNAGGNGLGYNDPVGSIPLLAAIGNHDLQDQTPTKSLDGRTCENGSGGETALARYLSYFEYEPNGVNYTIGDGETFLDYQRERSQNFHRLDYGPVTFLFLDANNGDDDNPEQDTNTGLFRDPSNYFVKKYGLTPCRSPDFNPGSKQYCWLTNNLADAQMKSKFTFVVCHQCPYSVGYHNCTNLTEYGGSPSTYPTGEWLSARALRILGDTMIRYGVDGWLCGHDEMMEHSQISGTEVLPDGTTRAKTVNIFDMGTAGDGLRGGYKTSEARLRNPPRNPKEVWRAHLDCPEVWENGRLKSGGKHYGHMEVDVQPQADGSWTCTLTPVYIFVTLDANSKPCGFTRCVYDDVVTLTESRPSGEERGLRVMVR